VIFIGRLETTWGDQKPLGESLVVKLSAFLRSFINHDNGDAHVSQRRGEALSVGIGCGFQVRTGFGAWAPAAIRPAIHGRQVTERP
jgi:hypothetical protein